MAPNVKTGKEHWRKHDYSRTKVLFRRRGIKLKWTQMNWLLSICSKCIPFCLVKGGRVCRSFGPNWTWKLGILTQNYKIWPTLHSYCSCFNEHWNPNDSFKPAWSKSTALSMNKRHQFKKCKLIIPDVNYMLLCCNTSLCSH